MKEKSIIKVALVVILALCCGVSFAGAVKETRDVGSFNQIVLKGAATVYVAQGTESYVAVDTEKDNLSNVKTNVIDNTLTVDANRSL